MDEHERTGSALALLMRQVERLHRVAPLPKTRADLIEWIRSELDEVALEPEGSEEAKIEAADVVALALHLLLLETDGAPVPAIVGVEWKLRRRLDEVEKGATWAQAKEIAG